VRQAIEFEWTKCRAGYRRTTADPKLARRLRDRGKIKGWQRDGDNIVTGIETAGLSVDRYRPLDMTPTLYAIFADTEASVEGAIDFCNRYGLLTQQQKQGGTIWQTLNDFLFQHAAMERAVALFERGSAADSALLIKLINLAAKGDQRMIPPMALFAPQLGIDADDKVTLSLVPQHLLSAMWLQLALHVAGDCKLVRCEKCQVPFVVGAGTQRRSTAMYCSSLCKVAAFRARMAK
jgi:hypothetical protein